MTGTAPMSDADALFLALCNERGGLATFSTIDIAVARRAAAALAGDGDPKDVAQLLQQLPPVTKAQPAAKLQGQPIHVHFVGMPDVSVLSEAEQKRVGSLLRGALRKPKLRMTRRLKAAVEVALLLDAAEVPAKREGAPFNAAVVENDIAYDDPAGTLWTRIRQLLASICAPLDHRAVFSVSDYEDRIAVLTQAAADANGRAVVAEKQVAVLERRMAEMQAAAGRLLNSPLTVERSSAMVTGGRPGTLGDMPPGW